MKLASSLLGKLGPNKERSEARPRERLLDSEHQLMLDVYQTDKDLVIVSTVAGVKPEDIDISITNGMLTIKGTRSKSDEVNTKDYYYQECYWGAFSRSVILPEDVDTENIKASLKNGILKIMLPKSEQSKPKRISINEG